MKIIELLNKIANGEEAPKKIKWEDIIYAYNEYDKDYLEYPFSDEEYKGLFNMKDSILTQFLNDEVEILEEKKETKSLTKKDIEALGYACGEIQKCFTNGWTKSLENKPLEEEKKMPEKLNLNTYAAIGTEVDRDLIIKINEIIDYLKSKGE